MRRKILGTMLAAALIASASSSFVSCKDYESDDLQELDTKLTNSMKSQVDALQKQLDDLKATSCNKDACDLLKSQVAQLQSDYQANSATWNSAIKDLNDKVSTLQDNTASWQKNIDDLKATVDQLVKDTEAGKQSIKALQDEVASFRNLVTEVTAALITNVIVQATNSPAVGTFALPLDIQANLLVTYYGNNDAAFRFPTNNSAYFYNADEADALSSQDVDGNKVTINAGTLYDNDGAAGNAGTLYVTVNPNTVDATGVNFALQMSNGKQSPVKVSAAKKDSTLLTWGYTRANDNNLYAINATIDKDNLNDLKANLNTSEILSAAKQLVTDRTQTKVALKELARKSAKFIFDNMSTDFPRLGLATSYTVNGKQLKNVSELSMLATAFKPAGFGALDQISDVKGVPGLSQAENRVANFINGVTLGTIKVSISDKQISKIQKINKINHISINADGSYNVAVNLTGTASQGGTVTINTTLDINNEGAITKLLESVETSVNSSLDNIQASLDTFNNNIDGINSLIDEINNGVEINLDDRLATTKSQLLSRMSSYLDKANDRFAYWFNRSKGAALKPCLLFNAKDGVHRVTANGVTVSGENITLIPTTYTYELIAPAYKKYIKVYSGSDVLYNQVIPGDEREVNVEGLKSGKSYKVVYEAVDYTGKVVARTYTINVK